MSTGWELMHFGRICNPLNIKMECAVGESSSFYHSANCLCCCTTTTSATVQANATAPATTSDLRVTMGATPTLCAEALWCLNTAVKHHSLNSNEGISELFKEMFPDSDIAKSFTCGKDKTGYIIRFGLASFFKKQLVDGINKAGPFVLMFAHEFILGL